MEWLDTISRRAAACLLPLGPGTLIGILAVVQAAVALYVVPDPAWEQQNLYGFGFADEYDQLGLMLSQGHGYRFSPDTALTLEREPGYPFLLAGIFSIFGYGLMPARAANVIFAALSAWILATLAARISDNKMAPRLAVLLFLVNPGVFVTILRGGVECLFTLLILCFILALYRAADVRTYGAYFLSGLLLGLASTVRSTALLFPAFLPFWFRLGEIPRPTFPVVATRLLVLAAGAGLVLSPWTIRNYMLVGELIPTASVQGVAAHAGQYICKNRSLESGFQDLDTEAAAARVTLARQQGYTFKSDYALYFYNPRDEIRFNRWLGKQVLAEYRRSPALFAKCVAENAFNFWFEGKNWTATFINIIAQLPYLIIGILGGVFYARNKSLRPIGLLVLFCLYTMLVYLPIHAQARYSVPLAPLLSLLAAVGAGEIARTHPGKILS